MSAGSLVAEAPHGSLGVLMEAIEALRCVKWKQSQRILEDEVEHVLLYLKRAVHELNASGNEHLKAAFHTCNGLQSVVPLLAWGRLQSQISGAHSSKPAQLVR